MPVDTADDNAYVYELLRKLDLTDFQARTGQFLVRPLGILLVILVAWAVDRVGCRAVRRAVRSVQTRGPLRLATARAEQRMTTIADLLVRILRVAIWTVALFVVLDLLGINLAPLIAGAGIAGLAIGFGAQSLVKDVIAGLFIVLEDQYGAGDVVSIGDATGTVEDLGLRSTRLRAVDGTVWFVPNGEIRSVGNSSMGWARALVDVLVSHDADLELVKRVVKEEAEALAADQAWSEAVLEPPELWGVQALTADGITVRLVVKTAPRQQFPLARELRGRISARLRREGVRAPGQTLSVTTPLGPPADAAPTGAPPAAPAPAAEPAAAEPTDTDEGQPSTTS